jgi:hypothetical protein
MEAIGCDMIFLSHAAPSLALHAQRRCESNVDVSRDKQKLQIFPLSLLHSTARPSTGTRGRRGILIQMALQHSDQISYWAITCC